MKAIFVFSGEKRQFVTAVENLIILEEFMSKFHRAGYAQFEEQIFPYHRLEKVLIQNDARKLFKPSVPRE